MNKQAYTDADDKKVPSAILAGGTFLARYLLLLCTDKLK